MRSKNIETFAVWIFVMGLLAACIVIPSATDNKVITITPEFTPTIIASPTTTPIPIIIAEIPSPTVTEALPIETRSVEPLLTPTPTGTPTRTPLPPDGWMSLPVIPSISNTARLIYQRGLESGNNPKAFSKIGDCGSTPTWFLGDFDAGPEYYRLGDYQYLADVILQFQGSFGRTSIASRPGFRSSSALSQLWADPKKCLSGETPLTCEYRINRPIIAFIMLGSNDVWHQDTFETNMRTILDYTIENGILPILSTKADNEEKNNSINALIAQLAWEYDIPLWNFWLAVQPLVTHGLQNDLVHLTWGPNTFDVPYAMKRAWPIRNLTALQTLDAVWRALENLPSVQH